MTIDDIIALAGAIVAEQDKRGGDDTPSAALALARAVLALLTPDKPCGWDASDVASDAGDGYVRVYALRDLHADEAQWCAVQILRAAEKAEADRG